MNFSRSFGVALCFGMGVSSLLGQVATNCVPSKHQVVLRQQVAELDAVEGKLDGAKLKAEIAALRKQGKVDEDTIAGLEEVLEKAEAAKGPMAKPEAQSAAYAALGDKYQELQTAQMEEGEAVDRAQADAALAAKMAELSAAEAAADAEAQAAAEARSAAEAEAQAAAEVALAARMAELRAAEAEPVAASGQQHAIALAALSEKMETMEQETVVVAADSTAAEREEAAQAALRAKMDEMNEADQAKLTAEQRALREEMAAMAVRDHAWSQSQAVEPGTTSAPKPEPKPAVVIVKDGSDQVDREATAQATLDATMTEINRAENVAVTGTPVLPAPATPRAAVNAQQVLRDTITTAPTPATRELPSSDKTGWERITELTDLYQRNWITPEEYHRERAKVLQSLSQ